jgi:hypothetical protein
VKFVYVYGGSGTFTGGGEFEWHSPTLGSRHRFILFVAQDDDSPQQDAALAELIRFGFSEVELVQGKPIAVEALNEPAMEAFRKHYEGAFSEGSSLVWYP